jgi:hypothetical protein
MRFLMLPTVRTSICKRSDKRVDNLSFEGERDRFDEPALVLDEDSPVMRGDRGHNVLFFQFAPDEVFGAVELDAAVAVDLADKRNAALGNGESQVTAGIDVLIEREAVREMAEVCPKPTPKHPGEAGPMLGQSEASIGFPDVVIAEEAPARSAQGAQIGAGVNKDALFPEAVKAFHGGVATGLSRRDKEKLDAQQEMEPDDLGEAVGIPASSRGGHLVVHLGDLGQSHKSPGINKMAAERDGLLIRELVGRGCLCDDIDRLEGVEASDAPGAPQEAGADQVGLLEIAHLTGRDIGIGRSAGRTSRLNPFGLAGPGQDLLDGRDRGKLADAPSLELEMDRFGADAGESRPPGLVGSQFVAQSQDLAHKRPARPIADMFRGTALITQSRCPMVSISSQPLGKPEATPLDPPKNVIEADSGFVELNGFGSELILVPVVHRLCLLPSGLERSLSDDQITYRCPYGFLHIDVLTETP